MYPENFLVSMTEPLVHRRQRRGGEHGPPPAAGVQPRREVRPLDLAAPRGAPLRRRLQQQRGLRHRHQEEGAAHVQHLQEPGVDYFTT